MGNWRTAVVGDAFYEARLLVMNELYRNYASDHGLKSNDMFKAYKICLNLFVEERKRS